MQPQANNSSLNMRSCRGRKRALMLTRDSNYPEDQNQIECRHCPLVNGGLIIGQEIEAVANHLEDHHGFNKIIIEI